MGARIRPVVRGRKFIRGDLIARTEERKKEGAAVDGADQVTAN